MYVRKLLALLSVVLPILGVSALAAHAAEPPAERALLVEPGRVQPAQRVHVSASVPGTIAKVQVAVGDVVKAGDVVAELDATRYRLECEQAQGKLEQARIHLRGLAAESPGEAQLAMAQLQVREAEIELELAKYNLDATQLRARNEGTILVRRAEVGQAVSPEGCEAPSGSLFELADLRALEAVVPVTETDAEKVFQGQSCQVLAAASKTAFDGKVARVCPMVDPATGTFAVHVLLELPPGDSAVMPGMFVQVTFLPGQEPANP